MKVAELYAGGNRYFLPLDPGQGAAYVRRNLSGWVSVACYRGGKPEYSLDGRKVVSFKISEVGEL